MQLNLLIEGNLTEHLEKSYKNGANAVTTGIASATDGLKISLRKQVKSAGLSSRLANTWRGVVYPKGRTSISAAGLVYSNAQKIMEGFEYQTIIRGKNGYWLAIPTEAIPKKMMGKKSTPEIYERARGIKLRFVYRRGRVSLLVHEYKKKTLVAFILVHQVKMPKLINFENEARLWQARLPTLILQNWKDND